jgi:hypothetical protein
VGSIQPQTKIKHARFCQRVGCGSATVVVEVRIDGVSAGYYCRACLVPLVGDMSRAARSGLSVLVQAAA